MEDYIVYGRTDDAGRLVAVNSSAYIRDIDEWTELDHGVGIRYHHAQGNYFPQPIMDDRGIYRYKLVDGKPVERTQEEMDVDYANLPAQAMTQEERITALEEENRKMKEAIDALMGGIVDA